MTEVQQLVSAPAQRRALGGIGASEAAAAIGASDYATPLDAWLVATGRSKGFAGNEATEWGHILEPIIRARYVEKHQVAVHVPPTSLWHAELPWLKATPDGIVIDEATGKWLYVAPQVKNVGLRMAPAWEDGIPTDYLIQGVVEMAVTQLPRIDFAVLIGGQSYREVTIERDLDFEGDVLAGLAAFWPLVESDTQPAIDESKRFKAYLLDKLKKSKRVTIGATETDLAVIARWREIVIEQTKLKREEGSIKNQVLSVLAASDAGKLTSALGAISLGNPRKKTAWKAVAEATRALVTTFDLVERELIGLRADADAMGDDDTGALVQRIDALRASLRLAAPPVFTDLVAANTKVGEPSLNRPRAWTKDLLDDSDDGDDE